MASYATGQVERLLGLPASTLRYWEREVSLLEPRKDAFGRRTYSEADLRILLRLRHLALRRDLGLSAAAKALVAELSGPRPEDRARIAELRGELIALFFASLDARRHLE
jgi:DNA-binding transcriptional MerR regulator